MLNIFENAWLFLSIAVVAVCAVWVVRVFSRDKFGVFYYFVPILIVLLGLGIDFFVKTDLEIINSNLKKLVKAAQNEDCDSIGALLVEDYKDSLHSNKELFIDHCKTVLVAPLIETNVLRILSIQSKSETVEVEFTVNVFFDKDSYAAEYKPIMFVKTSVELKKYAKNQWLINRIELLELDKQPAKWRHIKY